MKGKQKKLEVGNLDAMRDWGHAKDYVYGMWLVLQHDKPDDFILATNEQHSVREFIVKSFKLKGIHIVWKNKETDPMNEIGYDLNTGKEIVFVNPRYFRPTEVETLLGDATKANTVLGWKPTYSFDKLVASMVSSDCG